VSKKRVARRTRIDIISPMTALPENFVNGRDFERIARAIRYIDVHFRAQPRLAEMAAHAGLSEFHFNRLFRRWAGLTPKQYLAKVTGVAAREALTEEPSVLDAAHAVGLSGPGRLHDLVVALDAVTPGELKALGAGVSVRYGLSDTPFGSALFAATERGLLKLSFLDAPSPVRVLEELKQAWPRAQFVRDDDNARVLAQRLWAADGDGGPLRIAVSGTNLQLKVWEALLALEAGIPATYSSVAAVVHRPEAVRAVANAVGANPVAWLIPCHRVLRKSGSLGGYRWGIDRKRAMLAWESMAPTRASRANSCNRLAMLHRGTNEDQASQCQRTATLATR
jgi:AraC family transcriptional regulator of adaptative response/methylated-DNA-[protein]-cysteine methyltransferase